MKRILLEVVLALAMAGAAAFGYMSWKQVQGSKTEIEELIKDNEMYRTAWKEFQTIRVLLGETPHWP